MNKNDLKNIQLSPEEIQMPEAGMLEKMLGNYFRKVAQKRISKEIKEHAILPDGSIDNELADDIRRMLTLRGEVSLHRDVLEPTAWAALSGLFLGAGAVAITTRVEGKEVTNKSAMAVVASTALGAALDVYRVKRRFNAGLNGALSGTLQGMRDKRNPHWSGYVEKPRFEADDEISR